MISVFDSKMLYVGDSNLESGCFEPSEVHEFLSKIPIPTSVLVLVGMSLFKLIPIVSFANLIWSTGTLLVEGLLECVFYSAWLTKVMDSDIMDNMEFEFCGWSFAPGSFDDNFSTSLLSFSI